MRMQKEELITSTLKNQLQGPKRKYYSLTSKGEAELENFIERWNYLQTNVNRVLHYESEPKNNQREMRKLNHELKLSEKQ